MRDDRPAACRSSLPLSRRRFVALGAGLLGGTVLARPALAASDAPAGKSGPTAGQAEGNNGESGAGSASSWARGDMVLGEEDAPVTVIEYASLTCGHCAQFHLATLPALKTSYIEPGKIKLVFREFPLDGLALRASMLARCAGEKRYFPMLSMLYSQLPQWAGADDPIAALARLAKHAGISQEEFEACMADEDLVAAILERRLKAERDFGVESTPTFIIDGKKYIGALTFDQFQEILDPLLVNAT